MMASTRRTAPADRSRVHRRPINFRSSLCSALNRHPPRANGLLDCLLPPINLDTVSSLVVSGTNTNQVSNRIIRKPGEAIRGEERTSRPRLSSPITRLAATSWGMSMGYLPGERRSAPFEPENPSPCVGGAEPLRSDRSPTTTARSWQSDPRREPAAPRVAPSGRVSRSRCRTP